MDYRNVTMKLGNRGLSLAVAPDLVAPAQYRRLLNIRTLQEGQLATRFGLGRNTTEFNQIGSSSDPVVWMRRASDTAMLYVTASGKVYKEGTLLTGIVVSDPSSVSAVRFTSANSGQSWTYFACSNGLWKIDNDTGNVYKWGITEPMNYLEVTLINPDWEHSVTGELDASSAGTIPYQWVYTYYSSNTEAESNPSDITDEVVPEASGVAFLKGFVYPTDPQVDKYRIYRVGGSIGEFRLEDEIPIGAPEDPTYYASVKSDVQIVLNNSLSYDNDVPFVTLGSDGEEVAETPLPKVWGPFTGTTIFAVGDPYRPGHVYWTNPNNPDAASTENVLPITSRAEPLLNGFIYGSNPYVWSRDNLYTLDYGGPTAPVAFVGRQIPLGMGLSAPDGFAIGFNGVYFISKDGIYETDCQQSAPISLTHDSLRPLFLNQEVKSEDGSVLFYPIDWGQISSIRLSFTGQELHFLYMDSLGTKKHLVYDVIQKRWQEFSSALGVTQVVYGDENQAQYLTLYALADGFVYNLDYTLTTDTGLDIPAGFRTGSWDAEIPLTQKEWGVFMLDADCNNKTLTILPMVNNEQTALTSWTVTDTPGRKTFTHSLYDSYGRTLAFDISWVGSAIIYQIVVLFRDDEEPLVHWETPDSSFGIPGWKHVRDGYFGIRSWSDITLQVVVDGVTYSYNIPSTSGERRAQYVQFYPVKGKMYRWIMDSSLPFLFYGEDTSLYLKPWLTGNSYTSVSLGGTAPYAPYTRNQGGT